jgi:predicted metal-dependent hydrolase
MQQKLLNELYSNYAQRLISRGELEGAVYQYLSKNRDKINLVNWTDDEYEDFLSWFYPRLHKAIDSYRDTGASFDSFINTIFNISAKGYRLKTITKAVTEYSAWSIQLPELYASEYTPDYSCESTEENQLHEDTYIKIRKNPKQLLALILKCYRYVSDDFIDRIARHAEIDREKIKELLEEVRVIREKRDNEIYLMKERIYSQYYRCIVYEKRLSFTTKDSNAYLKLKMRLEKARRRLEKMRKRMAKIRTDATNREIAQVIGISKGAVDAGLYRIKTRWDITEDKPSLN